MNRRSFLSGILAAGMAPAIVKASSLMHVRAPLPWSDVLLSREPSTLYVAPMQLNAARGITRAMFAEQVRPGLEQVFKDAYSDFAQYGMGVYSTIAEAMGEAVEGDTVIVLPGAHRFPRDGVTVPKGVHVHMRDVWMDK